MKPVCISNNSLSLYQLINHTTLIDAPSKLHPIHAHEQLPNRSENNWIELTTLLKKPKEKSNNSCIIYSRTRIGLSHSNKQQHIHLRHIIEYLKDIRKISCFEAEIQQNILSKQVQTVSPLQNMAADGFSLHGFVGLYAMLEHFHHQPPPEL